MAPSRDRLVATSVTSYLEHVFALSEQMVGARCYRGEANVAWPLKPSIMRDVRSDAENQIFSELMLEAPSEFSADKTMFEKLVRAQHYSLPTRLLDVSLNPLVGLYFACSEEEHQDRDGVVRLFEFVDKRVKYADSDTISLICNLARLSDDERAQISRGNVRLDLGNLTKEEFRGQPAVERLMQFVRVEKPYFQNLIEPSDLFRYFFVYPAKSNRRVIAQSGAFIAAGLLKYTAPSKSTSFKAHTIVVPKQRKADVLRELDLININSRTMFPEIEFASKYIKKKWTVRKALATPGSSPEKPPKPSTSTARIRKRRSA